MSLNLQNCTILRWDDVVLLREVNEIFERNRITHLIGHNGIGKTSLMRCIAGYYLPYLGNITLDGQAVMQDNVTYLGHDNGIKLDFTPFENIMAYVKVLGKDNSHTMEELEYLFEIFKLEKLLEIPCHYLSHGQKRRVALATFLAKKAQVYLFDEPVNGLDKQSVDSFFEYLNIIKQEAIVIISNHQYTNYPFEHIVSLEKYRR